jgi:NMD protein affecting ribosome stability and mRNA decay
MFCKKCGKDVESYLIMENGLCLECDMDENPGLYKMEP